MTLCWSSCRRSRNKRRRDLPPPHYPKPTYGSDTSSAYSYPAPTGVPNAYAQPANFGEAYVKPVDGRMSEVRQPQPTPEMPRMTHDPTVGYENRVLDPPPVEKDGHVFTGTVYNGQPLP
jgi:hypothetical protein